MKQKVLWYSDFCCPTGFGNVAEAIVSRLKEKYDFSIVAINYYGRPINKPKNPYYQFRDIPIYPARSLEDRDFLGRQNLLNLIHQGDFDILFILQDTFNLSPLREPLQKAVEDKNLKYVLYFPVDAPLDQEWVEAACEARHPVVYTQYGRQEMRKFMREVPYIYHGVDEAFQPISAQEREFMRFHFLGSTDDDFIVANVNRNQFRKDLPRTLLAFEEIKERIPQAKLYLHTNLDFNMATGNDLEKFVRRNISPEVQKSIIFPDRQVMAQGGLSRAFLGKLYNCFDVVISTTRGEGWGLSCTEAMACGVPVAMPRHTSLVEIVGEREERGLLVDCDEIDVNPLDNEQIRPVVSIKSLVEAVQRVHENPGSAQERVEAAHAWVQKYCDWDQIAAQWEEVLDT